MQDSQFQIHYGAMKVNDYQHTKYWQNLKARKIIYNKRICNKWVGSHNISKLGLTSIC